ncbi:MAG: hypothetical protein ABSA39_05620 [Edaphobacter sp.]
MSKGFLYVALTLTESMSRSMLACDIGALAVTGNDNLYMLHSAPLVRILSELAYFEIGSKM